MRKPLAWAVSLATALTCTVAAAAPALADPHPPAAAARATTGTIPAGTSATTLQAKVDALLAQLPDGWQARLDAARASAGLGDAPSAALLATGTAAAGQPCASTAFRDWANAQPGVASGGAAALAGTGILDLPTLYAIYLAPDGPQYFGAGGADTTRLTHEMRDLTRFWDIPSGDIRLVGMHDDFFDHPEQVAKIAALVYGVGEAQAPAFAQTIIAIIDSLGLHDSPVLTLNSVAFDAQGPGVPPIPGLTDKIVIGDGMLEALDAVGLGEIGPQAILAHEFAHQVQFADHIFDSPLTGAAATRRTELMADAFGTYFLTHKRGEALNAKRVLATEQSFYQLGDCDVASTSHHGTPGQRLASSSWGADLAAAAQKQGHILPSLRVAAAFETELPALVATD